MHFGESYGITASVAVALRETRTAGRRRVRMKEGREKISSCRERWRYVSITDLQVWGLRG